jgi:hypothetical protein
VPKQMAVVDLVDVNPRDATGVSASPRLHVPTGFLSQKRLRKWLILIQSCALAAACVFRPAPQRQSKLCKAAQVQLPDG